MKLYNSKQDDLILLLNDDMSICAPAYRFLRYQRAKGRAYNTRLSYAIDLKMFFEYLQSREIYHLDVTPKVLIDYRSYLLTANIDSTAKVISIVQQRTQTTVDRMYGTVELLYDFLAASEQIDNPIMKANALRGGEYAGLLEHTKSGLTKRSRNRGRGRKPQYNLISESDADALEEELGKYGKKYRLIFRIMRQTGARIQEVLDLEISQIPPPDVDEQVMIIPKIKSKGKKRDLYIPETLVEEIDDYILNTRSKIIRDGGSPYLFVSESNNSYGHQLTYDGFYAVLVKARKKLGIDCNCHDLRHTLCTDLLKKGVPVEETKEIMGHKQLATTMTYAHIPQSEVSREVSQYWERKKNEADNG